MDRYAVIGNPVAHSKSPFIHAAFARQTGQALTYEAVMVLSESLAESLKKLHADGFLGINVTLPHKQAVLALCEAVSERAELAGAVNLLVRTDSGWRGDNADGRGFVRDLTVNRRVSLAGKRVLLLGAGGAARGLIAPILAEQPTQLAVSNRNPWKPEELAERFKHLGAIVPRTHLSLKGDRYDIIINATSAGHSGTLPRLPGQLLADGGCCYDLSYGASAEPFLAWAHAQGAICLSDGLGMLVEQAAVAFELWRSVLPQTTEVLTALRLPAPHKVDDRAEQAGDAQPFRHPHRYVRGQD